MISQFLISIFLAGTPKSTCSWEKTPILIGHRGAKARAPENTIASFQKALELGADGVEFDVYLSKDRVPFIFHDDTLERTTNGTGVAFQQTFEELQNYDAAKGWGAFKGAKIPSLKDTLEAIPDGGYVNVELKGEGVHSKQEFVDIVLAAIKEHRERLLLVLSSFDSHLLHILRKKDDEIRIGFLLGGRPDQNIIALSRLSAIRPNALHLPPGLLSKKIVQMAHQKGIGVMVWTVNDEAKKDELLQLGVDGIFSDLPEGLSWKGSKL